MGESIALPATEPAKLAEAICSVVTEDALYAQRLREGAKAAAAASDDAGARRFTALLELGYLVASADGLDPNERAALARLLEAVTGSAVDQATLERHFEDLSKGVDMLGRRERMGRAAADLDDVTTAPEAIGFAAAVSMADGRLDAAEIDALVELGAHCAISKEIVWDLVSDVARRVEEKLR
jgi:tellurite resistance protein